MFYKVERLSRSFSFSESLSIYGFCHIYHLQIYLDNSKIIKSLAILQTINFLTHSHFDFLQEIILF